MLQFLFKSIETGLRSYILHKVFVTKLELQTIMSYLLTYLPVEIHVKPCNLLILIIPELEKKPKIAKVEAPIVMSGDICGQLQHLIRFFNQN